MLQSIHQSLAALSKVIRGTQLLTPDVQKLASALLNQEVSKKKSPSYLPTVNSLCLINDLTQGCPNYDLWAAYCQTMFAPVCNLIPLIHQR